MLLSGVFSYHRTSRCSLVSPRETGRVGDMRANNPPSASVSWISFQQMHAQRTLTYLAYLNEPVVAGEPSRSKSVCCGFGGL